MVCWEIWAFCVMAEENGERTLFQLDTVLLKKVYHEDYPNRCSISLVVRI